MTLRPLAAALVVVLPVGALAQRPSPPDLVLTGGKVFTADVARPWAQAVAIRGARIVAVGTNAAIAALAGPSTRRIALDGRVVIPGINDAHDHMSAGLGGIEVRTDPSPIPDQSLGVVLDSIAAVAKRAPRGTWIHTAVGERILSDPHARRDALDRIAPNHPVMLRGWSGHGAILNTAALRATKLERASDPVGGWLERDEATRQPTGRIDEYALFTSSREIALARGTAPAIAAARAYGAEAARFGITTLQTFSTGLSPAMVRALAQADVMPQRLRIIPFPMTTASGRSAEWHGFTGHGTLSPRVSVSGVKWVLDGTPVERLALLRTPYLDRAGWHGRIDFPVDTIRVMLRESLASGEQPILHIVGDSAISIVLGLMRSLAPDSTWRRMRPRIEHGEGIDVDMLDAVRSLGIVVVQNPSHFTITDVMRARLGPARMARQQRMRSLLAAHIPIALGNDGPLNPYLNIVFATTHPDNPAEALTREQSVTAYTLGSAFAEHSEGEKGSLVVGKLADIAVLSQDIFTVPTAALPATTSVLTIVNGKVVLDQLTRPAAARGR